jgi:hypothetical protein
MCAICVNLGEVVIKWRQIGLACAWKAWSARMARKAWTAGKGGEGGEVGERWGNGWKCVKVGGKCGETEKFMRDSGRRRG